MKELDNVLNYYLSSKTDYALMIRGDWGIGKTYYFKHVLMAQIENTPSFEDASKVYKPLLVSLFGLKSVEEVQAEIFLSLYPVLKKKSVKLGVGVVKILINGMLKLPGLQGGGELMSDFKIEDTYNIGFSDLVICFDDLERISSDFNIEELIGYINSLVEREGAKVLIIANENKINNLKYSSFQEKIIGNSIEFIPDLELSLVSLVEITFSSFQNYKDFLLERKHVILDVLTNSATNFRVLSFALKYFQRVFSEVTMGFEEGSILKEKTNEILVKLLKFSLLISIEYKEHRMLYRDMKELYEESRRIERNSIENIILGQVDKNTGTGKESYLENFKRTYYSEERFYFFRSIFRFITGGTIFLLSELIEELNYYYHIRDNKIDAHYKVLNDLGYLSVFNLAERTYRDYTRKMLNYSDKGFYNLEDYVTVFRFASRFDNPLRYNMDKLENRIISGIKKGRPYFKYRDSFHSYFNIKPNEDNYDRLMRIWEMTLQINSEIASNMKQSDYIRLESLCYGNFQDFYLEVTPLNSVYSSLPVFEGFKVDRFYRLFLRSEGNVKMQIVRMWEDRYKRSDKYSLVPELPFLEGLLSRLNQRMERIPKSGITRFLYHEHVKVLLKSIEILKITKENFPSEMNN